MNFDINSSLLGKISKNTDQYNPKVLFRIPRSENRINYNLEDNKLPFTGLDVWNCYEFSFLTNNNFPVNRVLKIIYPAESKYLVESKSLKLYLNSFNLQQFGSTINEAEKCVKELIKKDLSELLESTVQLAFFNEQSNTINAFDDLINMNLTDLIPTHEIENIEFNSFLETPALLKANKTNQIQHYAFRSDLLRSNCRVTNQPDWGDIFIRISSNYKIDLNSVIAYLISFRKENHFHEEVVEMIYKRFFDLFEPDKLLVAAMYTRRGGIDINPIRATHADMIDEAFSSLQYRMNKTIRQ